MTTNDVSILVRASKAVGLLGMMVLHEDSEGYPIPYSVTYYDNGDVEVEWKDVKDFSQTVAYTMLCDVTEALGTEDYRMSVTHAGASEHTITTGNYFHEEVTE